MLTAKEEDVPFILQAQMLGYYVITTGNAPSQVGHHYADEYIPFDYSDYEGITQLAKDNGIVGVLHGCSDNCALSAAYICDHLGLKGHDNFDTTEIIHRKDRFKIFASEHGIKTPLANWFSYDQYESALDYWKGAECSLIVKPGDLAGGIGVSVCDSYSEYKYSIDYAFSRSNTKKIVVEPFVEGTLHSLHVFLVNKKVRAFGTANDYSFRNKYMTSYGIFPADGWEESVKFLIPEIERIALLLDLVDGQMDIQYIRNDKDIWIIEMMRRNPGNHTTGVIANSIGLNWREWIVRAELGKDVSNMPSSNPPQNFYGYYCVMASKNGIYRGIKINPEFTPFVIDIKKYIDAGHEVTNYLHEKMANVLFCFKTVQERNKYLPVINDLIIAEME